MIFHFLFDVDIGVIPGGGQGDHGPPTFQGHTKNIFAINYAYKGYEHVAPPL